MFTQRFRIWGSSDLRRWLPLDVWRPIKSTLVTLDVAGCAAEAGVHPAAARRSSSPSSTNCSSASPTCRNPLPQFGIASDSVS